MTCDPVVLCVLFAFVCVGTMHYVSSFRRGGCHAPTHQTGQPISQSIRVGPIQSGHLEVLERVVRRVEEEARRDGVERARHLGRAVDLLLWMSE